VAGLSFAAQAILSVMQTTGRAANPRRENIGLLQLVGQSLSIGPLVDVALFLEIGRASCRERV